jgi:hypothetical protein
MAAFDLSKLVKERMCWVASFLVAWAAALQVPSNPNQSLPVSRNQDEVFNSDGNGAATCSRTSSGTPAYAPNKVTEGGQQPANSSSSLSAGEQQEQ